MQIVEALMGKTEPELNTGCMLWVGAINEKNYGRAIILGRAFFAHRVSWELHNGKIPDGLWVLHKCDTPSCINPNHLFLGTHQDNVDDLWKKVGCDPVSRRERDYIFVKPKRSYCRKNPHNKPSEYIHPEGAELKISNRGKVKTYHRNDALTVTQVREIRASTARGVDLARQYGVATGTISKIRNRRLWVSLPD